MDYLPTYLCSRRIDEDILYTFTKKIIAAFTKIQNPGGLASCSWQPGSMYVWT